MCCTNFIGFRENSALIILKTMNIVVLFAAAVAGWANNVGQTLMAEAFKTKPDQSAPLKIRLVRKPESEVEFQSIF